MDFPAGSFDFVFCLRVLNQLQHNADKIRAIAEMARVLAPGGRMLFDVVNLWSLAAMKKRTWHISPPAVRRALRQCGMDNIRMTGRMIFTQTMLEVLPARLARWFSVFDTAVCRLVPFFATRTYFLARKEPAP